MQTDGERRRRGKERQGAPVCGKLGWGTPLQVSRSGRLGDPMLSLLQLLYMNCPWAPPFRHEAKHVQNCSIDSALNPPPRSGCVNKGKDDISAEAESFESSCPP